MINTTFTSTMIILIVVLLICLLAMTFSLVLISQFTSKLRPKSHEINPDEEGHPTTQFQKGHTGINIYDYCVQKTMSSTATRSTTITESGMQKQITQPIIPIRTDPSYYYTAPDMNLPQTTSAKTGRRDRRSLESFYWLPATGHLIQAPKPVAAPHPSNIYGTLSKKSSSVYIL